MKIIYLFSGIGAFEKALTNLNIDFELINFCEIDKYAEKSYCAIHNIDKSKNLGDITKIDISKIPNDIDLLTHGSPCTSFSIAGKQAGGDKDSNTSSSLMWYSVEIIKKIKPKYVIWENVKNVLSKNHKHNFDKYIETLKTFGYNNYYQVLNAKDYGVPQNRERIFVVSIRNDVSLDFKFPQKQILNVCLKDFLEDKVEESFILNQEYHKRFIKSKNSNDFPKGKEYKVLGTTCENYNDKGTNSRGWVYDINSNISCLSATDTKQPKQIIIEGKLNIDGWQDQMKRVYDINGLSPNTSTMQGGNTQSKIIIDTKISPSIKENFERDKEQIQNCKKDIYRAECKSGFQDNVIGINLSQTLRAKNTTTHCLDNNFIIRKLTPKECYRLMGFSDEDFEKAKSVGISNSQLYKQAGNSIVVNVLEQIFKNLFLTK